MFKYSNQRKIILTLTLLSLSSWSFSDSLLDKYKEQKNAEQLKFELQQREKNKNENKAYETKQAKDLDTLQEYIKNTLESNSKSTPRMLFDLKELSVVEQLKNEDELIICDESEKFFLMHDKKIYSVEFYNKEYFISRINEVAQMEGYESTTWTESKNNMKNQLIYDQSISKFLLFTQIKNSNISINKCRNYFLGDKVNEFKENSRIILSKTFESCRFPREVGHIRNARIRGIMEDKISSLKKSFIVEVKGRIEKYGRVIDVLVMESSGDPLLDAFGKVYVSNIFCFPRVNFEEMDVEFKVKYKFSPDSLK